ncbi:MAG: hypothetical protein AAGB51_11420 [Planctomycetota bacterium]
MKSGLIGAAALVATATTSFGAVEVNLIEEDFSVFGNVSSFYLAFRDRGNLFVDADFQSGGFEVIHFHDPIDPSDPEFDDQGDTIQSVHVLEDFVWDTAIDGEILNVSFSLDVDSGGIPGSDVYFVIEDASGGSFAAFTGLTGNGGFETITAMNLTNADFSGRDFVNGGAMKFGFGFLSSTFDDSGDQFAFLADNFSVTIKTVPMPGSVSLLGVAGIAAFRRSRR